MLERIDTEIDRALKAYVNLPGAVDLSLRADGITVHTNDFSKLIFESTGLDLRKYFIDAFKDADFLAEDEKDKLAADLFHLFDTVTSFVSDENGGQMVRSEVTTINLPPALSQNFVQRMNVQKEVRFRLNAKLPDDAAFERVSGITFDVGGKRIALNHLHLKAFGNKCIVTPILAEQGHIKEQSNGVLNSIKNVGKDLLVDAVIRMGKVSEVCRTELPIIHQEFRQYLKDAVNFQQLLHAKEKDLVMFIEQSAGICVDDPLTRSLLTGGMRVQKRDQDIELFREEKSICDLGGIALEIAPMIKLQILKNSMELKIDKLSGIGVEVPFDAPPELEVIGLDLSKSLPKKIVSLDLGAPDQEDRRRLVVRTAPGCWMSLDLNAEMQPATDANGNWIIVGVTSNPISGVPQKFFLRLDSSNNLNMTPREIAEVVTQTAVDGFDPGDPFTWTWGAVALGGQALLTAGAVIRGVAGDTDDVKKGARELGRLIGKFLNEL